VSGLVQASGPAFSRILAVDGVRGRNVVSNAEVAGPIGSSDQWIRQRTGIESRRRADPGLSVVDLAAEACAKTLDRAGIDPADIDAVICSTVTHFANTPSAAAILTHRIGAGQAAAYDISAACAGYCYGIGQADALIRAGAARLVLVVGAEKMSDFIDPADRSISFLLGDGAGAAVVGPAEAPGIGPTVWGSDGSRADLVRQTRPWSALREPGDREPWPTLVQEGPSVFKWAVWTMAPLARRALEAAGVGAGDLAAFIPHQANLRIVDLLARELKLPEHVAVARDIVETGNTSAASIPLATERLLREGRVASGGLALNIGFGAGLVYAAQVVRLP
jgi:3-oxoacyl-[acyl-carrier-protein] synthase-3